MTKTVRIENADTNTSVKVIVEVWDKGYTANDGSVVPDRMSEGETIELGYPTRMVEKGITGTRWLVVREVPS